MENSGHFIMHIWVWEGDNQKQAVKSGINSACRFSALQEDDDDGENESDLIRPDEPW